MKSSKFWIAAADILHVTDFSILPLFSAEVAKVELNLNHSASGINNY